MKKGRHRLHGGKSGAALAIHLIPLAAVNEIAGILSDGTLQIRLTAPLVEEKLNLALIDFLASFLELPAARIQIVAGSAGADRLVTIDDIDADSLHKRIVEGID